MLDVRPRRRSRPGAPTRARRLAGDLARHRADVLGGRAAAAADDGRAGLDEGGRVLAQVVGRGEVDVAPVDDARVAGVGHDRERQLRSRPGASRRCRASPAARACSSCRRRRRRPGRASRARATRSSPKAVRPSARNVISATIGISAERPRTARTASAASSRLPKVSSRMRSTPASSRTRACSSKISRTCDSCSEPYGLTSAPSGPDRARDEDELAGGRLPGQAHALAVDLLERVGPLVRRQLDAVGVPRVRREDPGAGVEVVVVDLAHGVRSPTGSAASAPGPGRRPREVSSVPIAPSASRTSSAIVLRKSFFIWRPTKKPLDARGAGPCGPSRGAPHLLLHAENSGIGTCRAAPRCAVRLPWGSSGRSLAHSGCGRDVASDGSKARARSNRPRLSTGR